MEQRGGQKREGGVVQPGTHEPRGPAGWRTSGSSRLGLAIGGHRQGHRMLLRGHKYSWKGFGVSFLYL